MKKIHLLFAHFNRAHWLGVCFGFLCTLLVSLTLFSQVPILSSFIEQMNFQIYDHIIGLNWHPYNRIPRVVVIDIDEESIHKEGRWPWRRDRMAELLNKLKQDGVVTIGLDIVMSEEEPNFAKGLQKKLKELSKIPSNANKEFINTLNQIAPLVDSDQILAQKLLDRTVVLGFLFHNDINVQKGQLPPPLTDPSGKDLNANDYASLQFKSYNGSIKALVNAAARTGFVTNIPDNDGAIRNALLLANYKGKLYPSMALATAMNYLLVDQVNLVIEDKKLKGIQLDGTFVPTNAHGQILIPYWGGPGTLNYYSATDVLQNKVNVKDLQGTIAIIGSSMPLLSDLHESPVSLSFPGVEIVGNVVQAIVSQQLIVEFDWATLQGYLIIILLGIAMSLLFPFININGALLISLLLILATLGTCLYLFIKQSLYLPIAAIITLILLIALINYAYSFILERRQKKHISHLFGQYVPEDYLKELIEKPEHFSMEGQTRNMTVLFADIRNFTSLSEDLDAVGVKRLLNTFFTPITEIIFKNRGTIDKYVGDMIVAFWGAPIEDLEHATHAVNSARAIFENLDKINAVMVENQLPPVQIGVGIATGLMNVGDMGSEFRRAYTVLGDTVNLASRLQDLTKFYKVDILVNDVTHAGQEEILWRTVDKVTVKGRKTALSIYEPITYLATASQELKNEIMNYHIALERYYAQDWTNAQKLFADLHHEYPAVYLYSLYLERVNTFIANPPTKEWDGVYIHLQK